MKKKIIFWFTGQMIHFGIAKSIQEKLDSELFAIFDVTNNPKKFFQQQQFVKFTQFWFYHDHISKHNSTPDVKYLEEFEKKYKIKLWLLAQNERLFNEFNEFCEFSTDEILSILEQECKFFEEILDHSDPDYIIMEPPNLHSEQLFFELCVSRGIIPLILGMSRFGYKSIISSGAEKLDFTEKDLENCKLKMTFSQLRDYKEKKNFSKNIKEFTSSTLNSKILFFKAFFHYLLSNNENQSTHYSYFGRTKIKVLFDKLKKFFQKKYRQQFINKNLIKHPDLKKSFIYYPMFAEPERVILIGAPFWTNQLEIIKQISKSIPINYKLYIKEHPMMFILWRKTSFYKEIMNLPNVVLIHPSFPSDTLMKKCSLVISVAGSSALEAIFYGKPSIIFANTELDLIPNIHKVQSVSELPLLIKKSLNEEVDPIYLNKYVNLVENQSIDFNFLESLADYLSHFYYGGFLVGDANITNYQMNSYLKKNKSNFDKLADEHIKKLHIES